MKKDEKNFTENFNLTLTEEQEYVKAKKKVEQEIHIGSSSNDGAFFYEPYDWRNAKVEEN